MQNKTIKLLFLLIPVYFSSCKFSSIKPSGKVTKVVVPISDFSGIHVGNGIQLFVSKEVSEKIEIETDNNIQGLFTTQKIGDNIDIRLNQNANFRRGFDVKVYVSYKNLTEIQANSGCKVTFNNTINAPKFRLDISDGCVLNGELNTTNLIAKIRSGSKVTLNGTTNIYDLDASDGCQVNGFNFISKNLDCKISAGTTVNITALEKLSANVADGSVLNYKGNAAMVSKIVNTGGQVNKL